MAENQESIKIQEIEKEFPQEFNFVEGEEINSHGAEDYVGKDIVKS